MRLFTLVTDDENGLTEQVFLNAESRDAAVKIWLRASCNDERRATLDDADDLDHENWQMARGAAMYNLNTYTANDFDLDPPAVGVTRQERAATALSVLEWLYQEPDADQLNVRDMLTDLRHICDLHHVNFHRESGMSYAAYTRERLEPEQQAQASTPPTAEQVRKTHRTAYMVAHRATIHATAKLLVAWCVANNLKYDDGAALVLNDALTKDQRRWLNKYCYSVKALTGLV